MNNMNRPIMQKIKVEGCPINNLPCVNNILLKTKKDSFIVEVFPNICDEANKR